MELLKPLAPARVLTDTVFNFFSIAATVACVHKQRRIVLRQFIFVFRRLIDDVGLQCYATESHGFELRKFSARNRVWQQMCAFRCSQLRAICKRAPRIAFLKKRLRGETDSQTLTEIIGDLQPSEYALSSSSRTLT
jgi:hypothetical protein